YVDGEYFNSTPPLTFSWSSLTVPNGSHVLSANAYGSSGSQVGTASVTVSVQNGVATPTATTTAAASPTLTATSTPTLAPSPTATPAGVDLSITKSHPGTFHQGDVGDTYTIVVRNIGAGASSGLVTMQDSLPPGLTATGLSGSGWSCSLTSKLCSRSD